MGGLKIAYVKYHTFINNVKYVTPCGFLDDAASIPVLYTNVNLPCYRHAEKCVLDLLMLLVPVTLYSVHIQC
jgi:hypothetical protein